MMPESPVSLWAAIPSYLLYGLCCAFIYFFVLSVFVALKRARIFLNYKSKDGTKGSASSFVIASKAAVYVGDKIGEAVKFLLIIIFSLFLPFLTYITFEGELRFLPIVLSFMCCTFTIKFLGKRIVRPFSVLLLYSSAVFLLFIKIIISVLYKVLPSNELVDNTKKQ